MAWDGNGTFDRVHNFSADASAGIQAQAVRFDAEFDGIKTGLENCQTLTGETTPTANSPMGGFKHTGVAAATSTDNYLRADQSSNQVGIYVRDSNTGVTGVMSCSAGVFPTAFTDGQRVTVKVSASGSTSAPRAIVINGLSANVLDNKGNTFQSPLMFQNGVFDLVYDASAGGFKLLNSSIPAKTVDITDAGGYYTGTEVETALAEAGATTTTLTAKSKSVIKYTSESRGTVAATSALQADSSLVLSLSVGAVYDITGHIVVSNASAAVAVNYRFAQDGTGVQGSYIADSYHYGVTASMSAGDLNYQVAHAWTTPSSTLPRASGSVVLRVKGIYPVSASAQRNLKFFWSPAGVPSAATASCNVAAYSYLKADKL